MLLFHFLIISPYQTTLWLVFGDKRGVRLEKQSSRNVKNQRERTTSLLSHQGVKWKVQVDFQMFHCKVTRCSMKISYSLCLPGNLFFPLIFAKYFSMGRGSFVILMKLCWNRGWLLLKNSEVSSLFMAMHSMIILPKDQDKEVSEKCFCVNKHSHRGPFRHNCSYCGNLVGMGGRMWAPV